MKFSKPAIAIASALAGIVIVSGTATASSLITSAKIKDGTIRSVDIHDGAVHSNDLSASVRGQIAKAGTPGPQGARGKDGIDALAGAKYRIEDYKNGGGGDATVACADDEDTSQQYIAIAGGVEAGHLGSNDFAVSASFPGRMDWNTGKPKVDRLDGWIVLGNGKYTDNLKVWALCVPVVNARDFVTDEVHLDN